MHTIEVPFGTATRCLLRPPALPQDARPPLLVILHGYGQDGERHARWMGPAVPAEFAAAFPDGLYRHEVRRMGRPARIGCAWYLFDGDRARLAEQLLGVAAVVWRVVDAAVDALGADPARVWLAGFSQGAYLAHVLALGNPERVAGWIGQAGNFRPEYLGGRPLPALAGRPVLLQHGTSDESLPAERVRELAAQFAALGAEVTVGAHDTGHAITLQMAQEARDWLTARADRRVPGVG